MTGPDMTRTLMLDPNHPPIPPVRPNPASQEYSQAHLAAAGGIYSGLGALVYPEEREEFESFMRENYLAELSKGTSFANLSDGYMAGLVRVRLAVAIGSNLIGAPLPSSKWTRRPTILTQPAPLSPRSPASRAGSRTPSLPPALASPLGASTSARTRPPCPPPPAGGVPSSQSSRSTGPSP